MMKSFYQRLMDGVAFMLMPDWTGGGAVNTVIAGIEFRGAGGDKSSVNLAGLNNAYASGSVPALRAAIAALSNAVPIGTNYSQSVKVADGTDAPLDESYSSVDTKLVLNFQDAGLVTKQVAVPAPDEQFFGSDGISAVTQNSGAAAGSAPKLLATAITAILAALNTGGGSFIYTGGYRSQRSRALPRPRYVVPSIEPEEGVTPGDLPGIPPVIP